MMVIRPVERGDIAGLMQLAGKTGGGLTSLPADEKRCRRALSAPCKPGRGRCQKANRVMCSFSKIPTPGTVAGICAIEVAVGLNDPWYNYRVGTMVHASKELNVYNALPTLFLCNDHTGASELCTLFLDPAWRKEGNGYLLSKSRFMFMAAFRDRFNEKVVAEMRGVIDDTGYSPFWESLGERFFSMEFSRADYLCGTGQKAFIAELMPKHPIYTHFLSPQAQAVIGEVHPQTAPAGRCWKKRVSATVTMWTSLTADPPWSAISTACVRSVKAGWLRFPKASLHRVSGRHVWWLTSSTTISAPCWCEPTRKVNVWC